MNSLASSTSLLTAIALVLSACNPTQLSSGMSGPHMTIVGTAPDASDSQADDSTGRAFAGQEKVKGTTFLGCVGLSNLPLFTDPNYLKYIDRRCSYESSNGQTHTYWTHLNSPDSADAFMNNEIYRFDETRLADSLEDTAVKYGFNHMVAAAGSEINIVTDLCSAKAGDLMSPTMQWIVSSATLDAYMQEFTPANTSLGNDFYALLAEAQRYKRIVESARYDAKIYATSNPAIAQNDAVAAQNNLPLAVAKMKAAITVEIYLHQLRYISFKAGACRSVENGNRDLAFFNANVRAANQEYDFIYGGPNVPAGYLMQQLKDVYNSIPN